MRRAIGGLLLATRKVRGDRCIHLYQAHKLIPIDNNPQHDRSHMLLLIRIQFCYTSACASLSGADPHLVTFAASPCLGVSTPSLDPWKIPDVKLAARNFFPNVTHCDIAPEQTAPEDSCQHLLSTQPHVSTQDLSTYETWKLLRLMKIEEFKRHLYSTCKHCMPLEEVISLCKQMGTAITNTEAEEILKSLDDEGSILIFRRKVFLEPQKVAELLSVAMPLPLAQEDDPRNQEFARLQKEKEEIDRIAHKQVQYLLWGAFSGLSVHSAYFFRLSFWDFSWDVMEPVSFFVTASSVLAGFFFFMITKRSPSYRGVMDILFSSRQRKLIKKRNFDIERFKELQALCLGFVQKSNWALKLVLN